MACSKDNAASRRVIERNGGALDSEVLDERSGRPALRLWIALDPSAGG